MPGFPEYEASTWGRVRSKDRIDSLNREKRGVLLRQFPDSKGNYMCVNLWRNGSPRMMRVHRIIAISFLPNPDNLPEVNHKDEDKRNNAVSNLEWCTHQYNNTYGSKRGKWVGEKNVAAKFSVETARFIYDNHIINGGTYSTSDLSRMTGVSLAHTSAIAHKNRRTEELSDIHSRHARQSNQAQQR